MSEDIGAKIIRRKAELKSLCEEIGRSEKSAEWEANYVMLRGLSKGVEDGRKRHIQVEGSGRRVMEEIMAKKLCCYYMHKDGYTLQAIANTLDLKSHATVLRHQKTAEDLISPVYGDRDYRWLHKKATELGIAR
jgi:hypothetical protein